MNQLEQPDSHHLDAAIGWLGLGCAADAHDELTKISPANLDHPGVLEVRWLICVRAERWSDALEIARLKLKLAPDEAASWLHHAYALRRASNGGLILAWGALLPAAAKFPEEPVIAFNLACYACQLRELENARLWLHRAVQAGGKDAIKPMALADDDLKPLWPEIEEL